MTNKYTLDDCVEAIEEVAELVEQTPTINTYKERRKENHPGPWTIRRRFGSWDNAIEKTDLREHQRMPKELEVDYFKEINTERKAYWLGLIYADGSVQYDDETNRFSIKLSTKDGYLVEQMKEDLGSTHKLSRVSRDGTSDMVGLIISVRRFVEHLVDKGVDGDKTRSSSLPNLESERMWGAFVRGMFDGDGWVGKYQLRIAGISAGRWEKLRKKIPCKMKTNNTQDSLLQVPANSRHRFFDFMYPIGCKTQPKMERKYATFKANLK